jgi:hypothetical protein
VEVNDEEKEDSLNDSMESLQKVFLRLQRITMENKAKLAQPGPQYIEEEELEQVIIPSLPQC